MKTSAFLPLAFAAFMSLLIGCSKDDTPTNPTPTNSRLVFSSTRSGNSEVYSSNTDGTGLLQLTNNLASDESPRLSPTGDKIAFNSNRTGRQEVFVMNVDGTNQTQPSTTGAEGFCDWTNDGKIVYSSGPNLYKVNRDGTNLTKIASAPSGKNFTEIVCSPSLPIIAVTSIGGWGYDRTVYLMSTDGSDMRVLLQDAPGATFNGSFTPDGSKLLYAYDVSGHEEGSGKQYDDHLFLINVDGTGNTDISKYKPSSTNDKYPTFTANGSKIIFCNNSNDESAFPDLWTMNLDGSNRTKIVTNGFAPNCR